MTVETFNFLSRHGLVRDVLGLKYSIPQNGEVKLAVFDLTGKELETLVDKVQSPGNYEVVFNAGKLSSGIYFYRLNAGDYVKTKEMLLIK